MAQKYYNVKEASQLLGVTEEQIHKMQEQRELYGYRDGADWKFKSEDVERLAAARPPAAPAIQDSSEEVLLSEVALGQSSIGASGTVIGMESTGKKPLDSALSISTDSEIHLAADSNLAALEIGLARIRAECPHFDAWLRRLEDGGLGPKIRKTLVGVSSLWL